MIHNLQNWLAGTSVTKSVLEKGMLRFCDPGGLPVLYALPQKSAPL